MSFAGHPLAQLTDVFHQHLLQHLPASSLARLRASCRAFFCLVDSGPNLVWRKAAESLIPSEALPQAASGQMIQTRLRQQAAILTAISTGRFSSHETQEQILNLWSPSIFYWAPCHAHDGLSHYLLAGTCLLACSPACCAWGPCLQLPGPHEADSAPAVSWHAWCMDPAGHLHLVYICRLGALQDCICVLDVALGKLSSTRMLNSYRSTMPPSIRGSTLLLRDSSSCVAALNVPGLDAKFKLIYQKESIQPECQTVEWAGWSSSGQILIIWSTCDKLLVAVHEPRSGSLQAMHRIENGHFERFNRDNVSPAPHHPFLALAYREAGTDEEDDDEAPRPGHHAAILCLGTGRLHPVVYGGDSESLQCWASWDWAPSGLAVVFQETSSCGPLGNTALHIWHAPSTSIVYSARGQCKTLVRWSPNGQVCVLVKGGEIEHVLHLCPTASKPAPAELYLEERHRPYIPDCCDQPSQPGAQTFFSISPCSTHLVACGCNLPGPSHIEHWNLALDEGCFDYEPVMPPLDALKGRRPVVAWYPGIPSACIYAVVVGHTAVQIMSGRESKPLASWPVFHDGNDISGPQEPVYALSWSPDGQRLVCRGPERLAIFRF